MAIAIVTIRVAGIPPAELDYIDVVASPEGSKLACTVVRNPPDSLDLYCTVAVAERPPEGALPDWRIPFDWPWPSCTFRSMEWDDEDRLVVTVIDETLLGIPNQVTVEELGVVVVFRDWP